MFGLQADDTRERVFRFRIPIQLVEGGSEMPGPFRPGGPKLHRLLIEPDGFLDPSGLPRRGGFADDAIEFEG